jgi:hypothetical protein
MCSFDAYFLATLENNKLLQAFIEAINQNIIDGF